MTTPYPHKYKTVMCRFFEKGAECPYGEDCNYAHGEPDRNMGGSSSSSNATPIDKGAAARSITQSERSFVAKNGKSTSSHQEDDSSVTRSSNHEKTSESSLAFAQKLTGEIIKKENDGE